MSDLQLAQECGWAFHAAGREQDMSTSCFPPPSPAQVGRIHSGPDWASEPVWGWGQAVNLELGKRVQSGSGWGSMSTVYSTGSSL